MFKYVNCYMQVTLLNQPTSFSIASDGVSPEDVHAALLGRKGLHPSKAGLDSGLMEGKASVSGAQKFQRHLYSSLGVWDSSNRIPSSSPLHPKPAATHKRIYGFITFTF